MNGLLQYISLLINQVKMLVLNIPSEVDHSSLFFATQMIAIMLDPLLCSSAFDPRIPECFAKIN